MPKFQYLGGDHGINLLESALAQPQQVFGGKYLYRTIFDKAAALFYSLVKNHCLVDGNKRLALTSLAVFLTLNEYVFFVEREEAVNFTVRLASGDELDTRTVSKWIRGNAIKFDRFISMSNEETVQWFGAAVGSLAHRRRIVKLFEDFWMNASGG